MSTAIQVNNLSKVYRLGEYGTGTLSLDFQRWLARVRGMEDPYLTIGEENNKAVKGGDVVYSLRDINFEIEAGRAVGIIGRNGAGKSTLLKILSRITSPTAGRVHIKGRVASLLEVGTGFHPELTGKENIYLNGAIMGMRKREIDKRLDEIIDFSGVERYINTPVKRYSSGMYVRLAFAVAAHLESEILIIDEVLAVGDTEFQKKCLGKMDEVTKADGRTVLFVSHNLSSINTLCNSGILLSEGNFVVQGEIKQVISRYKTLIDQKVGSEYVNENDFQKILMRADVKLTGLQPEKILDVNVSLKRYENLASSFLVIDIINSDGVCLYQSISSLSDNFDSDAEVVNLTARMKLYGIVTDSYTTNVFVCNSVFENIDYIKNVLFFDVLDSPVNHKLTFDYKGSENGYIYPPTEIIRAINGRE
jgi:lipopolysaccharide transport system ATP-binding protein